MTCPPKLVLKEQASKKQGGFSGGAYHSKQEPKFEMHKKGLGGSDHIRSSGYYGVTLFLNSISCMGPLAPMRSVGNGIIVPSTP